MKTTRYFDDTRRRPDRAEIRDEWIVQVTVHPEKTEVQSDGRIRKWARIPELGKVLQRVLRPFVQGERAMRVKYFTDTDTALLEFTDNRVTETREISENIYVDLDAHGNLVSMTIEHARTNTRLDEFSLQAIPNPA